VASRRVSRARTSRAPRYAAASAKKNVRRLGVLTASSFEKNDSIQKKSSHGGDLLGACASGLGVFFSCVVVLRFKHH
jgi:hypothetical protein